MVVDRFFTWVAEATVEQKLRAVEALVAALFDPRLGESEREAVEAAVMLVAEDPELAVRRRLAEVLADIDEAPRHLLLTLLDDHPSVAVAIAARSRALIDAELVDVVAHGVDQVRRAVAGRRRVGPTVAAALAEAGDRTAGIRLLDNPGADIPAFALERLVERFGEFAEVRRALLARPHVPITVRHRVLEKLAEAMENLVVVKSWMGRERAEATTRDSREKATIALAAAASGAETVVLVEHLRRTGQLTTRLMLRAACVGDLRFVEEALARLAGVPTTRVTALVADGRESALRALYRRAAMPERAWPAFHAAIEVHRELLAETGGLDGRPGDRARFARRLVERVLTRFTAFERRDADDLLVLLRRYAADAAREHVRHVMAERMADAERTLAAPSASDDETAEVAPTATTGEAGAISPIDATILEAVARELAVALDDNRSPDASERVEDVRPASVPAFVFPVPEPLHFDEHGDDTVEYDEPGGLFAHVRLEDLPPEWLVEEEIAPEAIFGEDDVLVRRGLDPEPSRVVTETRADVEIDDFAMRMEIAEDATIDLGERVVSGDAMNVRGDEYGVAFVAADAETAIAADATGAASEPMECDVPSPEAAAPWVQPRDATENFVDSLRNALDAILATPRRAA